MKDNGNTRRSSNASNRIKHGPHVCFRMTKPAHLDEFAEFIRTQIGAGSVSNQATVVHPSSESPEPEKMKQLPVPRQDVGKSKNATDAGALVAEADSYGAATERAAAAPGERPQTSSAVGLVIKSPWIEKILAGETTWEIRGRNTKLRGRIALIKSRSGKIYGTCRIAIRHGRRRGDWRMTFATTRNGCEMKRKVGSAASIPK
jgi:hypothetical protein